MPGSPQGESLEIGREQRVHRHRHLEVHAHYGFGGGTPARHDPLRGCWRRGSCGPAPGLRELLHAELLKTPDIRVESVRQFVNDVVREGGTNRAPEEEGGATAQDDVVDVAAVFNI